MYSFANRHQTRRDENSISFFRLVESHKAVCKLYILVRNSRSHALAPTDEFLVVWERQRRRRWRHRAWTFWCVYRHRQIFTRIMNKKNNNNCCARVWFSTRTRCCHRTRRHRRRHIKWKRTNANGKQNRFLCRIRRVEHMRTRWDFFFTFCFFYQL